MVNKENLRHNGVSLEVTANANENIKESSEATNIDRDKNSLNF